MNPGDAEVQRAFGFRGTVVTPRKFGSARLIFFVDLAHDEVSRRRRDNAGAIVDRRILNALWEVPADIDYPSDALPPWVLERLKNVAGVDISGTVRRTVRPPLTIRGAAVVGRSLPRLLDVLGPLSSVCPTAAVVTGGSPPDDDAALLDAQLFGVAVGWSERREIHVLTASQQIEAEIGTYQWHLAELVYAEIAQVS